MPCCLRFSLFPLILFLFSSLHTSAQSLDDNWDTRFSLPGIIPNSFVSWVMEDDGTLYALGNKIIAHGTQEGDLVKWDGQRWTTLHIPSTINENGKTFEIHTIDVQDILVLFNNALIFPVQDNEGNTRIASLDIHDEEFRLIPGGKLNGTVTRILLHNARVYIGGEFTDATGLPNTQGLVFWDGLRWGKPEGKIAGSVTNFIFDENSTLYVFNRNYRLQGQLDEVIQSGAKWDGQQWIQIGTPEINKDIMTLAVSGNRIFTTTRNSNPIQALRLVNTQWEPIGLDFTEEHIASAEFIQTNRPGKLFLYAYAYAPGAKYVMEWDGFQWKEFPLVLRLIPRHIFYGKDNSLTITEGTGIINDTLIALGAARWDGQQWTALASESVPDDGLLGQINSIEHRDGYLYAGGWNLRSTHLPGTQSILRWSESSGWESLGGGINGIALIVRSHPSGGVIVAGCFDSAGNMPARNIAHWDGRQWRTLGSGLDICVRSIATAENVIYAAGEQSIFRFEDGRWERIPGRISSGSIKAVAAGTDGTIFIGGEFDSIDSRCVNNVAVWKNGTWTDLNGGVQQTYPVYIWNRIEGLHVNTLAVDGDDLYVGGLFDIAGTIPAFQIARWDGTRWHAMDSGLTGRYGTIYWYAWNGQATVRSIRIHDGTLYAAGQIYGAGSWDYKQPSPSFTNVRALVRWDATNRVWNPLLGRSNRYDQTGIGDIAFDQDYIYCGKFLSGRHARGEEDTRSTGPLHTAEFMSLGVGRTRFPSDRIAPPSAPQEIDFGPVFTGRSLVKDLLITNPASSHRILEINVGILDGPFHIEGPTVFKLAPEQSATIPVTFTAERLGWLQGKAVIHHNATTDSTPLVVNLSGIGSPLSVHLSADPVSADFGTVRFESLHQRIIPVTFTNASHSNTNVTLTPTQPREPFSLLPQSPYAPNNDTLKPVTLGPGEEHTWEIAVDVKNLGNYTDEFVVLHNASPNGKDSTVIPLTIDVQPAIHRVHVTPAHINFGEVELDRTETRQLIITNDPQATLGIRYHPLLLQKQFKVIGYSRKDLNPGDSDTLSIQFTPDTLQPFEAVLKIVRVCSYGHYDTTDIPLRGVGKPLPAHMSISPKSIDFGNIAPGQTGRVGLIIWNQLNSPSELRLSIRTPRPPFNENLDSEARLSPAESQIVQITFTPETTGQFTDTLFITHNAYGFTNPLPIPMRGESSVSGVNQTDALQAGLALFAEPNPVSGTGSIRFRIQNTADVSLRLFALDGREVAELAEGRFEAGEHVVAWNTRGLAPGTYLCRLSANGRESSIIVNVQ